MRSPPPRPILQIRTQPRCWVIRVTCATSCGGTTRPRSNDMTQDHSDPISRTLAVGNSRRKILRVLGVGGASGLLAVAGLDALAGERPHERLQDRTPTRNKKQRNKKQNNNNNNNNNNNDNTTSGGGGLGGFFGLGTSVSYAHQNADLYYIRVFG